MTPLLAGGAVGLTVGAASWLATAATTAPTDYAGIALIIGAASTFVGTVGGLIIALRRSNSISISRTEAAEIARALHDRQEGEPDAT